MSLHAGDTRLTRLILSTSTNAILEKIMCGFDLSFFFFQAEDGIRDDLVTGVQTCALPICQHLVERLDEIGILVEAFNEMLAEIQRRTAALETSSAEVIRLNKDLERRVSERDRKSVV